jgi:hypothetical protein
MNNLIGDQLTSEIASGTQQPAGGIIRPVQATERQALLSQDASQRVITNDSPPEIY